MSRRARPIVLDMLFCTEGRHWAPTSKFRRRISGRLMSWCEDCKREYDRVAVSLKREALRERLAAQKEQKAAP